MAAQLHHNNNNYPSLSNNYHHIQNQPASSSSSSSSPPIIIGPSSLSSSSSLLSSSTHSGAEPPSPPAPKIIINASHYSMLINGNEKEFWSEMKSLHNNGNDDFDLCNLVCKTNNSTILHLAASVGQSHFIDSIIPQTPQLLHSQNSKGDLPIHVAARAGQNDAVESLVNGADRHLQITSSIMLERENEEKNTALHIALENQQKDMAMSLFNKCPKTFYHLNEQKIAPLYLAIKAEFWELIKAMLADNIVDEYYEAENQLLKGISIIHAAITAKNKDIFALIIRQYGKLLNMTDEMGRRPLSYAAYSGFLDGVKHIISTDTSDEFRNEAFKIDDDGNGSFPIHWACIGGNMEVVKEFFSSLPEKARLMLNNKDQNILHVAAAHGKAEVVEYILRQPGLKTMINAKDEDGNTPLHLASKGKHAKVVYDLTWDDRVNLNLQNKNRLTALDFAQVYGDIPSFEERLTWLSLIYAGVQPAPQLHNLNINIVDIDPADMVNNHTATAIIGVDQRNNQVLSHPKFKRKNKYKERIHALLVVATLVATVTFASGFTVPGGYSNNKPGEGMATLAHKSAFQVFVISNTIAMYSAILAVVTLIWAQLDDLKLVLVSLDFAVPLLGISLAMMSVAFMAGLYVVLHTIVCWLALVVLLMGGMFLGALLVIFIPFYSTTSCNRNNKMLRYVFHVPFTLMLLACNKG